MVRCWMSIGKCFFLEIYGEIRIYVSSSAHYMAQILQPLQTAVSNFSDSINNFFGVGDAVPHTSTPQPLSALAVGIVETDPHHFSAVRWMQEIER